MEDGMELAKKSDEEILRIIDPIMDNLMTASTDIDHERHVRDFTDRIKRIVTQPYLEQVCAQYQTEKGFFAERECVAIFRRPDSIAVIWRQKFSKKPGEYVAELVLVEQDAKYLVDHVMVF
jgi:hypothetical protein